jgi:hypothetical protein
VAKAQNPGQNLVKYSFSLEDFTQFPCLLRTRPGLVEHYTIRNAMPLGEIAVFQEAILEQKKRKRKCPENGLENPIGHIFANFLVGTGSSLF